MGCINVKPRNEDSSNEDKILLIRSVVRIQRWYRNHVKNMEIRRQNTWLIFKAIEQQRTMHDLQIYRFFTALIEYANTKPLPLDFAKRSSIGKELPRHSNLDELGLIDEKQGPAYLSLPIRQEFTKSDMKNLAEILLKKHYNALHPRFVCHVLVKAHNLLLKLPNMNIVEVDASKKCIVVGKLNGNIEDLTMILLTNGYPSDRNIYIFNGDTIGNTKTSFDVFILVLFFFLAYPNSVFLNRGRNEDALLIERTGFSHEVRKKYNSNGNIVLNLLKSVFRYLPLATLVNNQIFIVHGGIKRNLTIQKLMQINRDEFSSLLRPSINFKRHTIFDEWQDLVNLLWSKPTESSIRFNTTRADDLIFTFGPDCTYNFLLKMTLTNIVRSRDSEPEGFSLCHNSKVITCSSSSNYYASTSNKGAYLGINELNEIAYFKYETGRKTNKHATFRQRVDFLEEAALHDILVFLRQFRHELDTEFQKYDKKGNREIQLEHWYRSLSEVSGLKVPWYLLLKNSHLRPTIGKTTKYSNTLAMLSNEKIVRDAGRLTRPIFCVTRDKESLEIIFNILDVARDGTIELTDLEELCKIMQSTMTGRYDCQDVFNYAKAMPKANQDKVTFDEFVNVFKTF